MAARTNNLFESGWTIAHMIPSVGRVSPSVRLCGIGRGSTYTSRSSACDTCPKASENSTSNDAGVRATMLFSVAPRSKQRVASARGTNTVSANGDPGIGTPCSVIAMVYAPEVEVCTP